MKSNFKYSKNRKKTKNKFPKEIKQKLGKIKK